MATEAAYRDLRSLIRERGRGCYPTQPQLRGNRLIVPNDVPLRYDRMIPPRLSLDPVVQAVTSLGRTVERTTLASTLLNLAGQSAPEIARVILLAVGQFFPGDKVIRRSGGGYSSVRDRAMPAPARVASPSIFNLVLKYGASALGIARDIYQFTNPGLVTPQFYGSQFQQAIERGAYGGGAPVRGVSSYAGTYGAPIEASTYSYTPVGPSRTITVPGRGPSNVLEIPGGSNVLELPSV